MKSCVLNHQFDIDLTDNFVCINDSLDPIMPYVSGFNGAVESVVANRYVQSLALDLIPVVGQVKTVSEVISGIDPVTSMRTNRALSALVLVPGTKLLGKFSSVIQNGIGQIANYIRNPNETHFSLISMIGSGVGAGMSYSTVNSMNSSLKSYQAYGAKYNLSASRMLKDQIALNISQDILTSTIEMTPNAVAGHYSNKWGW